MNILQKVIVPDDVDLYFVGDTHGCYNLYKKGIKDLGIKDTDYVISVGDLIDRGTQNVPMTCEFTQKPNRYAVMGNHEWMMIQGVYESQDWWDCWLANGGDITLNEVSREGVKLLVDLVKNLPLILEIHHRGKIFGVVHGGVPLRYENRGMNYKETSFHDLIEDAKSHPQEIFNMMWDREALEAGKYHEGRNEKLPTVRGVDYMIHGHSYVPFPEVYANRIYIDTGSVFNNKLCFVWFEQEEFKHYRTGDFDE